VLFAFHGAYLRIDATTGRAERVALPESVLRRYLGGSGLGARLLLDEGGATAEPFSRDAPLSGRQNCLFR
jgi:aldehyde:ferredoxin oxidoreductase